MAIIEVKCGFCGSLQRFSEKTEVALCEECNHEIPLASSETGQMKHLAKNIAVEEDPRHYDLILIAPGGQMEPLLGVLQRILALNRNQVKELLNALPNTLLTGIPKRKATLLAEELKEVGAATDVKLTPGQ
jgi:ribosomal protein L7/L12